MATAEQPLKKRKIYEAFTPVPDSAPSNRPTDEAPESTAGDGIDEARPPTPPPLSQDEILRRRRNQEEIRNVFEIYKRLKRCVSSKDSRSLPELEQAFHSLLSVSRGCRSVQRIVSECIPQYAPHCPTALEAATQVIINIHNWSLPVISRAEDVDGVTLEIAMTCIDGLVGIFSTASSMQPTSSVIQGICSAVFRNVLSFFISNLEGKDLSQMIDKEAFQMLDVPGLFSQIKQKVSSEDGDAMLKLSKLRALSFLQLIFSCPRDLLVVCFDLFGSPATDVCYKEGKYLIVQLVNRLNVTAEQDTTGAKDVSENGAGIVSTNLENCLLGLILRKNQSLKRWLFSRCMKLSHAAPSQSVSEMLNVLQGLLGSCKDVDNVGDNDEGNSDTPDCIGRQSVKSGVFNQQNHSSKVLRQDFTSPIRDRSRQDNVSQKFSGGYRKHSSSAVPAAEVDHHSSSSLSHESNDPRSVDFKSNEHGDVCHGRSSMPVDLEPNHLPSPVPRKPLSTDRDNFEAGERSLQAGRSQSSIMDGFSGRLSWFYDGDPAAMDVFSASRQLWVGSLPPEASEGAVRYQFERFGPLENYFYYPVKGFALAEYRCIMDAIKAREYMRGCPPWNAPIRIKFMDTALGSRGAIDGVAVGSSCHVYVGNIFSHWMKDDIVRETLKVVYRGPRMITELASEGAVLLEFGTPEEATSAMAHLRRHRRGGSNYQSCGAGSADVAGSRSSVSRSMSAASMLGSPPAQAGAESHTGMHMPAPDAMKADGGPEFVSPRSGFDKPGLVQGGPAIQSSWPHPRTDTPEPGAPRCDIYNNSVRGPVPSQGAVPRPSEPMWTYRQPEFEHHPIPGTPSCIPIPSPAPAVPPSPQIQRPPYMPSVLPPAYYPPGPPSSSWDPHGFNHPGPYNAPPAGFMPPSMHGAIPPPFVPASVTPLSQIKGSGTQHYGQMVYHPPVPSVPPPLPPSPPPLPPPSSPPPPPPPDAEPSDMNGVASNQLSQWQGSLSKSGVRYCTISALRLESGICKYANGVSEPADWPVKLDMTKRTDFRHVKSTFSNSQPHRREVCQLLPASSGDHKGFQDFMSYLKQRECAGVIKIPAINSLWTRLLFILPCSPELCSLLGVTPDPSTDCLIAVILPKETNLD